MFYSLSQYPGKTGEYYYNTLFKQLKLPYTYTALACTDLTEQLDNMRVNAKGFSVSMPFKEKIFDYLDLVDPLAASYSTVNTVLVEKEQLTGYTADYYGAAFIRDSIPSGWNVTILGDGSMGKLISRVIGNRITVVSRKLGNWDQKDQPTDVIINCTALGTATKESPFTVVPDVKMIFDLAIADNQLKAQCQDRGVKYIAGIEFYKRQFIKQFEIYTGNKISLWDFTNIQK